MIGSVLNEKPILQVVNGNVVSTEQLRGKKKVIAKLIDLIKSDINNDISNKRIGIAHGDNISEFDINDLTKTEIGPSIGFHAGPGTIGICVWNK